MSDLTRHIGWFTAGLLCALLVCTAGCGFHSEPAPIPVDQGPLVTQNPLPVAKTLPGDESLPAGAGPAAVPASVGTLERGNWPVGRQRTGFEQWTIEQTALDALIRIGEPAVPSLITLLNEPDSHLRGEAVVALSRIGPEAQAAVPRLIALAQGDPDEAIRKSAVRALGQIGPAAAPAVPVLIEKLEPATTMPDRGPSYPPRRPSGNRPVNEGGLDEG
jgi:hypothetical protein